MTRYNTEYYFDQIIQKVKPELGKYKNHDLAIGVSFGNEQGSVTNLIKMVDRVLQDWMGKRQLIVAVGDSGSSAMLQELKLLKIQHPHLEFLLMPPFDGHGMRIRVILEICCELQADLLLFNPYITDQETLDSFGLESFVTPIQGQYDMAFGSLCRYHSPDSIDHMLVSPILENFYGTRIGNPISGIYAVAYGFIQELAHEARFWGHTIAGHGMDYWLLTRALCWNKNICEVNMGGVLKSHSIETRNNIFYDYALAIFESLKRDHAVWQRERLVVKTADIVIRNEIRRPDYINHFNRDLRDGFRLGCTQYRELLDSIDSAGKIQELMQKQGNDYYMPDDLWAEMLLRLFLIYSYDEEKQRIALNLLTALYNGRVASHALEMERFVQDISLVEADRQNELITSKMDIIFKRLNRVFRELKPRLSEIWLLQNEQIRPPIIPLAYMEYIPNRPVVVPKIIKGKDSCLVQTDNIFKQLRQKYQKRFDQFIHEGLGITPEAVPDEVINSVAEFMNRLERNLDRMLPGDLQSIEGMRQFVDGIFKLYPGQKIFTIGIDLLKELIIRFPPINLMIPWGYYKPEQLVDELDPRDVITYAGLVESWSYSERDLMWLLDHVKPGSFEWTEIKPLVLGQELHQGTLLPGKLTYLNRVTARLIIKPLSSAQGGKYPKLRYFTSILRRLASAENYTKVLQKTVAERKNIGEKLSNVFIDSRQSDDFSAYNIFENYHHRQLVEKIRELARCQEQEGQMESAALFYLMADGYGLGQTLENEVFLTCTAWSWASYSYKGGLKIPTPLTTSVESRWFNHDFLESLYQELGYEAEGIMTLVIRLILSGKGNHNILDTLMPTRPKDVEVIIQETTNEPSKHLLRYPGNPLLEPLEESSWECKYVLNPGALRIKDKVYLFYRAVGSDGISHIGLAITDGSKILKRLSQPVFSPHTPEESRGCEDPRLIIIDDKIFMLYTAYDGNIAQIAAASILVKDFIAGDYTRWHREGLAFKNIWDKDAIILPEKINGKYVVYHRIEPSIWITFANELKFPLKEKHAIIAGPRPGRMWDSLKIGAGAQPLKTIYGWLLIYHGVDYNYVYRLGVLLADLQQPQKILYRSPNPILEPEEDYEIGLDDAWVPNVVFTCGAVPGIDKDILEDDDEILVYYGAADTSIGMAKASLADLIPPRFRRRSSL